MTAFNQLHNPRYTRRNSADRDIAPQRQPIEAPELSRPQFRYEGNGNYAAVIPAASHGFIVKAFTPGGYWRVFHVSPEGGCTEQDQRLPFDMAAVHMWRLLANTAYSLMIDDDRRADEAGMDLDFGDVGSAEIP